MSRTEFRESIDVPRPAAAIAMVATASLTLTVTGQLAPWAVALAVLGIGAAALLREAPRDWQHSGPLLNGSIGAIMVVSAWLFVRGELAVDRRPLEVRANRAQVGVPRLGGIEDDVEELRVALA